MLVVGFGSTVLSACTKNGATLSRPDDPVVLEGSSLPKLLVLPASTAANLGAQATNPLQTTVTG